MAMARLEAILGISFATMGVAAFAGALHLGSAWNPLDLLFEDGTSHF